VAPKRKTVDPFDPLAISPPLTLAEVAAIQAVAKGEARPDQQQLAMKIIIERIARNYEETYCPGAGGERDSILLQGRRRVGTALVSYINAPLKNFRDPEAPAGEQD
jgi:hypothetical protein